MAYGHIGPKTVRTRDTSAPVHEDISALRLSGPNAETVRTVGPDTSVLGLDISALVPQCPATAPMAEHRRDSAFFKDSTQRVHRKQHVLTMGGLRTI